MFKESGVANVIDRLDSEKDVELAKEAQRCLVAALDHSRAVQIALVEDGKKDLSGAPVLTLPPKVLRLFAEVLGSLAQGKAVAVMPKELDISTQEAAMYLNVSRPYFVKLLESGAIPHHKVGAHRRVRFEDVMRYKEQREHRSQQALQELSDQAQDHNMGY
jgi:excisionase family DNA binding protein